MDIKFNKLFLIFLLNLVFINQTNSRSIHRLKDPNEAVLVTSWVKNGTPEDNKKYSLRSYEFESPILFELYDKKHFFKNLLPKGEIPYRNNIKKSVDSKILSDILNKFIKKLYDKKFTKKSIKKDDNFKILKARNFDFKHVMGQLILRYKKYPFVVKLYIETPKSFLRPAQRDFLQRCIFYISGGSCRYILGFTRIKNLNFIRSYMKTRPSWKHLLDFPRKWFWLPENPKYFKLEGYNLNNIPKQEIELPSIYAIISDGIEAEREFEFLNEHDRHLALTLSSELGEYLDPNIYNYMVEKNTGKLVLIDTEHFPSNLGFCEPLGYTSYETWLARSAGHAVSNIYLRNKKTRQDIRNGKWKKIMPCKEHFKELSKIK